VRVRSSSRRTPAPRPAAGFTLNGTTASSPSEARAWTIAAAVLIAAFFAATLVVIAGPHRIGDYFTESDFYGAYAQGARLIQHGHLLASRYTVVGPGYELALALVGLVIRDLFLAAQLLSAASAACIAGLWFTLLTRRVDARLGAAVLLFLCTNDGFFRYAFSATTDTFGIAFQSATLFALLGAPATASGTGHTGAVKTRRFAVAGLLAAFAFLTRYNAIALLPAGLLAILAGGTGAAQRGRAAVVFTLAFLGPVVPWVAYSLAHGGTLTTQLHHNIAYEVFARSKGIAWDNYQRTLQSQFPNLGAVIARDPGAVAARMVANVFEHLRDDASKLLGWPVAIAAVVGFLLAIRSGWLRALWPILASGALLFLTLVPVFYSERYSLALLPVYATLSGAAFASPLVALAIGRGRRVWLKALAAPAVVALALSAGIARQARTFEQLPVEVLEAGKALHSLRQPGDRVISRKAHIAYYGDCEPIGFPFADDLQALGRYAHDAKARWLYMSWPEVETRPAFYFLLDTAAVVPGLTVRYSSPWRPAVLYEIGPDLGAQPAWFANDTLRAWHVLRARSKVDSMNPEVFSNLGLVASYLGRLEEARDALDHATTLDPSRREDYVTLGRVQIGLGDFGGAGLAYRRAMEMEPGDADARMGYGLAAFLGGHDQEAAAAWRPMIPMTAEPRILRAMVQLFDSLGDHEAAGQARARLAERTGG
jgi:tetratricopeptide (TPR) repeat protein